MGCPQFSFKRLLFCYLRGTSVLNLASHEVRTRIWRCLQVQNVLISHKYIMEDSFANEELDQKGELLPGTLTMLILKTLASGAMHGAGAAKSIYRTSEGILRVEEGALYPALSRLELKGLLESEWGLSENKRRAKFYRLTAEGGKKLVDENARWNRVTMAIGRIMERA
jgi:PadR family transcriptional regulator, regulatory protein PadR